MKNAYAIVPSQGMYQSGDTVHVARRSGSLETARKIARKLTAEYQAGMQRYGGSSGGYRVIAWGTTDRTISGYSLDRIANAK
ncbi:MAG: hypothetical protein ACK528_05035 [Alphaproteobacteria bacterium]|jgi:hypothetical protein